MLLIVNGSVIYEYGMKEGSVLRPDAQGFVHAPSGPGLGVEVDWEAMNCATIARFAVGEGEWGWDMATTVKDL